MKIKTLLQFAWGLWMLTLLAACPAPYDDSYNPYGIGNDSGTSSGSSDGSGSDNIATDNVPSMPGEQGGSSTSNPTGGDNSGVGNGGSWANVAPPPGNNQNSNGGGGPFNGWNNNGNGGGTPLGQQGDGSGGPQAQGGSSSGGGDQGGSDPSDGITVSLPQKNGATWTMVQTRLSTVTKYDMYTRLTSYYTDLTKQTGLQTQVAQSQLGGLGLGGGVMGPGMLNGGNRNFMPGMGMNMMPGMQGGMGYGNAGMPMGTMNGGMMPPGAWAQGATTMPMGASNMQMAQGMMMQCQQAVWQLRQMLEAAQQRIKELEEESRRGRESDVKDAEKLEGKKEQSEELSETVQEKLAACEKQQAEEKENYEKKIKKKEELIAQLLSKLSPSDRSKEKAALQSLENEEATGDRDDLAQAVAQDDVEEKLEEDVVDGNSSWIFNPYEAPASLDEAQENLLQRRRKLRDSLLESIGEPTKLPFPMTPEQEWIYLEGALKYLKEYTISHDISPAEMQEIVAHLRSQQERRPAPSE